MAARKQIKVYRIVKPVPFYNERYCCEDVYYETLHQSYAPISDAELEKFCLDNGHVGLTVEETYDHL